MGAPRLTAQALQSVSEGNRLHDEVSALAARALRSPRAARGVRVLSGQAAGQLPSAW